MRVTIKGVNQELAARGIQVTLSNAGGYFLFRGPAVSSWLDRTVQVSKVGDLTIEQWLEAFNDLKRKNEEIVRAGSGKAKRRSG